MSLGGLAIAVGILVDGAVVVVENVVERLSDLKHAKEGKLHSVFVASAEVAKPVASGLTIIALVFLPLLSLEGLEGKLFAPVAMTIVLALLSALLLSLTLIPVLAYFVLKVKHGLHDPWLMRKIEPRYTSALHGAFARKTMIYGGAAVSLVVAAFGLVPLLFASGPGSEIQRPLAIVVIGGLFSATILTPILLPLLYERFGESGA